MKKPTISVLLNSYNKPYFLPFAVESVLSQSFQDFELIIIDGGSAAKGMKELLDTYAKNPKIKVLFTHETENDRKTKIMHSVAMNKALEVAKGKYITYLCDDDMYLPRRFEKMVAKMQLNKQVAVVYSQMQLCNMDMRGKKWNYHIRRVRGLRGGKARTGLTLDTYIDLISFMHKKSCLESLEKPYFPEEPKSEQWHYDGLFAEKLGKQCIFYPVNDVLFEHRYTPSSTNYPYFPVWRIFAQMVLGWVSRQQFSVSFGHV